MFVVRIRFVRSSEKVNDDDEKEAKGSLLHFIELQNRREEQLKRQMRGIGIPNKNSSYVSTKFLFL